MKKFYGFIFAAICCIFATENIKAEDAFSTIDLANEAEANRMRFDKNFKDKQFSVTGEIFKIEEKQGKYMVYLHGAKNGNPMKVVACQFDPQYEDTIMKMDKGSNITAECVYRGKQQFEMWSFTLVDCVPK